MPGKINTRSPFLRQNVTSSDKRGTKSLGRSQDNSREHHLGVNLSMYWFWFFLHCLLYHTLSLTVHSQFWLINDFNTQFKLQKSTLTKAGENDVYNSNIYFSCFVAENMPCTIIITSNTLQVSVCLSTRLFVLLLFIHSASYIYQSLFMYCKFVSWQML